MHREIESRTKEIAEICRRHRVKRLDLFGSAARGADFDPETSDADFLVAFTPPMRDDLFDRFMGLKLDLSDALDRDVDLIRMGTVRRQHIQAHIDGSRETVYEHSA